MSLTPRFVKSVLVEEEADSVTVTWVLGERAPAGGYCSFECYYHGPDGNGGKRFGIKSVEKITAYVWDNASATQANYDGDIVTVSKDRIVARYRDASIGLTTIGTVSAVAQSGGRDYQTDIPVTVLR